jgi:hypothetical protein
MLREVLVQDQKILASWMIGFGDDLKGGARYSSDRGRIDDMQLHEVVGDEFEEEELELEPNYDSLKHVKGEKSSLGGARWGKKSDLNQRNSEKVSEVLKDLNGPPEGQILDLDLPPTINWNDNNPRGGFAKANADDRRRGVSEMLDGLRNQHEELILEQNNPKLEGQNPQPNWKKQSRKVDESVEKKLMEEFHSDEELMLSQNHRSNRLNANSNWKKEVSVNKSSRSKY